MPFASAPIRDNVFVLIAPGFEEDAVAACVRHMREAGLAVSLVSVSAGLVSSLHGLVMRSDLTLDQLRSAPPPRLVVVPGSVQCALALLVDPRVHRLFQLTVEHGGHVAVLFNAQSVLVQAGIPGPAAAASFIPQGNWDITQFVGRLVNLVLPSTERAALQAH
jgi:putative intracellular protease/amidase